MPRPRKSPKLVSNDILIAEFEYISRTASEANADRGKIVNFYNLLFTAGSLSVGFLITNKISPNDFLSNNEYKTEISLFLSILFLLLTTIIASNLAQLARLRAAWHESIEAMHRIKDLYIKMDPEIAVGFKWSTKQIPPKDMPLSISNFVAFEASTLGALTTSISMYFLLYTFDTVNTLGWVFISIGYIFGFLALWRWYKSLLGDE